MKFDPAFFDALEILALRNVVKADNFDYHVRKMMRYYSEHYHTPIHEVELLPLEDVATHYFEAVYEDAEPKELEERLATLLETDEELRKRQRQEDLEDVEMHELAKEVVAEQKAEVAVGKGKLPAKPLGALEAIREFQKDLDLVNEFFTAPKPVAPKMPSLDDDADVFGLHGNKLRK